MAIYAIGDVHGALEPLDTLLEQLEARGDAEAFWFVGDLVNRGPDSAGVLRRVRGLGQRARMVLGNHDLALLGIMQRDEPRAHADASLHDLIDAPDCDELLDWLRHQPLILRHDALDITVVHAGLPPDWSVARACDHARELETALRGPDHAAFLKRLFGNTPNRWDQADTPEKRFRFMANALTRIRFVDADGRLDMKHKKRIADAPSDLAPWFCHPERRSRDARIVFGHWSALEQVCWPAQRVWGIDTGAAWGGTLSALRLDADLDCLIETAAD